MKKLIIILFFFGFSNLYSSEIKLEKIVDGLKGLQVGVISPRGRVVTPPVVSGKHVSFVVELPGGDRLGTVHNLPSGSLANQFRA